MAENNLYFQGLTPLELERLRFLAESLDSLMSDINARVDQDTDYRIGKVRISFTIQMRVVVNHDVDINPQDLLDPLHLEVVQDLDFPFFLN